MEDAKTKELRQRAVEYSRNADVNPGFFSSYSPDEQREIKVLARNIRTDKYLTRGEKGIIPIRSSANSDSRYRDGVDVYKSLNEFYDVDRILSGGINLPLPDGATVIDQTSSVTLNNKPFISPMVSKFYTDPLPHFPRLNGPENTFSYPPHAETSPFGGPTALAPLSPATPTGQGFGLPKPPPLTSVNSMGSPTYTAPNVFGFPKPPPLTNVNSMGAPNFNTSGFGSPVATGSFGFPKPPPLTSVNSMGAPNFNTSGFGSPVATGSFGFPKPPPLTSVNSMGAPNFNTSGFGSPKPGGRRFKSKKLNRNRRRTKKN
jgi:hypothetical protein